MLTATAARLILTIAGNENALKEGRDATLIAYIRGRVIAWGSNYVIVDTGGIGYRITVPPNLLGRVEAGEEIELHTVLQVREDGWQLYGFSEPEEAEFFSTLQKVSGIGPKGAMALLSFYSPAEMASIVSRQDINKLTAVPGIGRKTAQRLLLELKDRLAPFPGGEGEKGRAAEEVAQALVELGFSRKEAEQMVEKVLSREEVKAERPEELLRQVLREMGQKKG